MNIKFMFDSNPSSWFQYAHVVAFYLKTSNFVIKHFQFQLNIHRSWPANMKSASRDEGMQRAGIHTYR